jgi:hypothetical protein
MNSEEALAALEPQAGDALPDAVADFYQALGAGRPQDAAASFAADAIYAIPSDLVDESSPRNIHRGAEIRQALAADPALDKRHAVRLCCREGSNCLLEGPVFDADGDHAEHFAASIQLDGNRRIARMVVFRTPPIEDVAGTAPENPSGIDIRSSVDGYFSELETARFEKATGFFSADCLYSHPPYAPGRPRAEFRGEDELLAGFEARGPQTWTHEIPISIQRGPHLMLEGYAYLDGTPSGPSGTFVSSATVDAEGRIKRYLAVYTAPRVERL